MTNLTASTAAIRAIKIFLGDEPVMWVTSKPRIRFKTAQELVNLGLNIHSEGGPGTDLERLYEPLPKEYQYGFQARWYKEAWAEWQDRANEILLANQKGQE